MGVLEVSALIDTARQTRDVYWAWENYSSLVRDMIMRQDARSVIEIGGGRFPAFSREEIAEMKVDYTSNDISARELARAPDWIGKAHFDIQTDEAAELEGHADRYDFAFSKMVQEHLPSYERAYRNIHTILAPGGTAIAFHPVLGNLPFVANFVLPEKLSEAILKGIDNLRHDDGIPKFPATYSGCFVSQRVRAKLRAIGFSDVEQIPIYGHAYYRRFPVLRDVHRHFSHYLRNANVEPLASYAFTIVRK